MENQLIRFSWDIHYRCNFRCPYCWFYREWANIGKKNLHLSPDEWLRHWKRIYNKYGEVMIEIVGGEPFVYPDFIDLVKKLSDIHKVKITTNLSGDIERFVKEVNPNRVNLDLNYHMPFIDLSTVINKTLLLNNAGFKSGICFLAYPPQMKQIDRLSRVFKDAGIGFALAAFWGEHEGKKYPEAYTDEERELMRPYLGDINRLTYHLDAKSPRGRLCNAGYKYAIIQGDGNVVRCGSSADKSIGNILDDDFRLLDGPMLCESDTCPCNEYVCLSDDEVPVPNAQPVPEPGSHKISEDCDIFTQNKRLNQKEISERKIILDSKPLRLGVVVTNWCNLDCIMCPTVRHDGGSTISSSALSKINPLLPYLERIEWQGGEFFNLKFVKDMFYSLEKYPNITHGITTNGLLLDKEWIELLLRLNVLVTFSIDSPTKDVYEYIRKNGKYDKLLENLELILELESKHKKRLKRNLVAVVMRSNHRSLEEFIPFVQRYGFEAISFNPVMFIEGEENIFKNINFNSERLDNAGNYIKDKLDKAGIGFNWNLPGERCKDNIGQGKATNADNADLHCSWPWQCLWIGSDREGNVYPDCWCLTAKPIGNIYKDELLDVWNNEKMQEYRKKIASRDFSLCSSECISGYATKINLTSSKVFNDSKIA